MDPMTLSAIMMALSALGAGAYDMYGGADKLKKVPTLTGGQQGLLDQLISNLGGGQLGQGNEGAINLLQQLMNPDSEAVSQFTEPYMKQFEQQTVPGLAERFAGMGAMGGGLSSSGFGQSLSAAGGNLQSQLAALKAGLGQQAAGQLMGQYGSMLGQGLGTPAFAYQQKSPSALMGVLGGWGQMGPMAMMGGFGKGIGG